LKQAFANPYPVLTEVKVLASMQATRGRAFMHNFAVLTSGIFLQKILFCVIVEDGLLLPAA
jgi:hypothetical protein